MKIPILCDTHFGIRNDSNLFFDYFMKFYDNIFFPHLEENNIKTIIHAGDFLDRRKYVNFNTLNRIRKEFLGPLRDMGITMYCIPGNHDTYYKNTNEINCLGEVFDDAWANIVYVDWASVHSFGGMDIALLPWINQNNKEKSLEFIANANASWLIGHLELKDFEILRGIKHDFGMDHELFSRYEQVISGHYHCRSEKDNIKYLGAPYQMTFSDVGDTKGFWTLDTGDRSLEFIENPYRMFYSIKYSDSKSNYQDIIDDASIYGGKYVKIYVTEKNKPEILDELIDSMYSANVHNLTVIEDLDDITTGSKSDKGDLDKSTIDLLVDEIKSNFKITNQERIQKLLKELYMEALRT